LTRRGYEGQQPIASASWRAPFTRKRAEAQHFSLALVAIAAEFFGGLGLIVGLLGRVAAFGIIGNMLVAVVMVHAHFGFS
jgi:uncharacterized membrane protein YphA (DoxX/SURF4 family)